MRTPQPSIPPRDPDSFFVLKISKRAAFFLFIGLIAIAAAIAFRPAQTTASRSDTASPAPVAPADPAPAPAPAQDQHESQPAAVPTPVTDPTPPAPTPAPNPEPLRAAPEPPRPEPAPATTVVRRVVTYHPAGVPAPAPEADSSSNANDAPAADQPADANPSPSTPPSADPPSTAPPVSPAFVNGAGASSPYPLYTKWFESFHRQHPDVQFNYQSVGSAGGMRQLIEGTIDFSAVDVPLTDEQLARASVQILHVPSVITAVVPVYNLPDVAELHLTPRMLAEIFTGRITTWNNPQIVAYNPAANLPALPIVVIHRSDGCSTTQTFSDYLSKVSQEWQEHVGEGTSINWPLGLGAKGNEGVSSLLKQYSGAISYVDFGYATENHLAFASVQNRSGRFLKADAPSLKAAAASSKIPNDFRVWITNAPGSDAYPIASFEWFLAPVSRHGAPTRDLGVFFKWMTENSQQSAAPKLGFAPLPRELVERIDQAIANLH